MKLNENLEMSEGDVYRKLAVRERLIKAYKEKAAKRTILICILVIVIAMLMTQIVKLGNHVTILSQELSEIGYDNVMLDMNVSTLEKKVSSKEEDINLLKEELTILQNENLTLQAEYQLVKDELDNLNNITESETNSVASVQYESAPIIQDMSAYSDSWYIESLANGEGGFTFSKEMQSYTYQTLKEHNIAYMYPVMLALMEKESGFNPSAISATNDYGITQINGVNHKRMADQMGLSDEYATHGSNLYLDPYVGIEASVKMLQGIIWNDYTSYHEVLMVYNMGGGGAQSQWNKGVYSSDYSRAVLEKATKYGYTGDGNL